MRDFLRDLKNRVLPSPFKVLILLGSWDFGYLTATFDSHHPLFFMPAGTLVGIFLFPVFMLLRGWKAERDKTGIELRNCPF